MTLSTLVPSPFSGEAAVALDDFYAKAAATSNAERLAALEAELGAPKEAFDDGRSKCDLGWLRHLEYEFLAVRELVNLVIA